MSLPTNETDMNITEFFKHQNTKLINVYVTNKDMTVDTFVWIFGHRPYQDKCSFFIPKGTELVVCVFSNFGDGYSMCPFRPRKVFKGKHMTKRWFKCLYVDMDFVEYRIVED